VRTTHATTTQQEQVELGWWREAGCPSPRDGCPDMQHPTAPPSSRPSGGCTTGIGGSSTPEELLRLINMLQ
jgi:hypothetical protein